MNSLLALAVIFCWTNPDGTYHDCQITRSPPIHETRMECSDAGRLEVARLKSERPYWTGAQIDCQRKERI